MVYDKRRSSKRKSIGWARHSSLPVYLPRVRINGNQISVQTAKKERIVQDGESSIHLTAADWQIGRNGSLVFPDHFARLCIQGDDGRRRFSGENGITHYKGS